MPPSPGILARQAAWALNPPHPGLRGFGAARRTSNWVLLGHPALLCESKDLSSSSAPAPSLSASPHLCPLLMMM